MIVEANVKFQTFQLPLKYPALKQSVPLCYVINLCLKGNVKHKLHKLRVESCMRLLTVNHFNFIAANQVLRRLKDVFRGVPYEPPPISATVKLCYTFGLKWHSFLPPHCPDPLRKNSYTGVIHNSVAEWSARRTRNPAVSDSSPALATCWICSRSSRVQILGHACKSWPTGCLLPVGILHSVILYLNYLFSKYLLIVKRFGSLRERRYISVYYYYYLQKHSSNCIKLFLLRLFHPLLIAILFPSSRCKSRYSSRM